MATNNITDGMGKKIVEALKMQSAEHVEGEVFINEEVEEIPVHEEPVEVVNEQPVEEDVIVEDDLMESPQPIMNYQHEVKYEEPTPVMEQPKQEYHSPDLQNRIQSQLQFQAATQMAPQSYIDNAFNQSLAQNLGPSYVTQNDDFDYPANVAVLKQLIAKLPAGVSKTTGALIIRQTMEALGISMGSVLQEAKQVQDVLYNNSKECQNSVVEYRKQIGILEAKAQQYQRQATAMADIINLFIQTR